MALEYLIDEGGPIVDQRPDATAVSDQTGSIDLIGWGDDWYVDEDGTFDAGWASVDFDETGWRQAPAPFHREESESLPGSVVATPDGGMTTWFRRTIDVDDPSVLDRLTVEAMVDDGMVIWINGVEVDRWNMPDGQIEPDTDAVERISGVYELLLIRSQNIPPATLRSGVNVIAVEVHQATKDSSDTRFDLHLSATEG